MSVNLLFVIVDFRVRFGRWRLPLSDLHRRRRLRLTGTLLSAAHPPGLSVAVRAFALMVLLTSRFYIRKRRSYEFAIHNTSSNE